MVPPTMGGVFLLLLIIKTALPSPNMAHGKIELVISSLRLSFLMILDWAKVAIKTDLTNKQMN